MATKKIFKSDVGVVFRVFAGTALTTATEILMQVKKPDGSTADWTAAVASDNVQYATYTTTTNDLALEGDWILSLKVTFPGSPVSTVLKGASAVFTVYKQFED